MKKGVILVLIMGVGLSMGFIFSKFYRNLIYKRNYVFDFLLDNSSINSVNNPESRNFGSSFIYIQLIRENNEDDLNFFSSIADNWKRNNLKLILIANDPLKFINSFGWHHILYLSFDQLSSHDKNMLFKKHYYLYAPKNKLLATGTTNEDYEYSAKIYLMKYVDGVVFKIDEFLPEFNLNDFPHFRGLWSILKDRNREFYIIAFFTYFCNSCSTGYLVYELEDISMLDGLEVWGILYSKNYDPVQLMYLREQSRITFALDLSDDILNTEWNRLIRKYNDKIVNNLIILIDKQGNILKTFYPGINYWNEFRNYVLSNCRGDIK
ncbi:MAG: hypothetical protein QME85_00990 [Candidatus Saccharicenans sp.]|nr:hypothetical protein [Candidatus Saccharicenans sp.]MDI6850113.1 hypothetical protein [Candidatus Saccharicenans sp.]